MDFVASPAFQADDQEDEDFFEQLANDLAEDDHVPDPVHHDSQQEETMCNEVLSKQSISSAGASMVNSSITEEDGKSNYAGDDFWLDDTLCEASAASLQECTGRNPVMSKENLGQTLNNDIVSEKLDGAHMEVNASICALESRCIAENHVEKEKSMPSESASFIEADVNHPQEKGTLNLNLPLGEGSDVRDFDSEDNSVAAEVPITASKVQASTGIKELQWSNFNEVFAHEDEQGAFPSYSDFFKDLDACAGSTYTSALGAQSEIQNVLSSSAPPLAFETAIHANPNSLASLLGKQGIHDHNIESKVEREVILNHASCAATDAPVLMHYERGHQNFVSGSGAPLHGDFSLSNSSYGAQYQGGLQQTWENMYPGWFYDHASNEWKQIEAFNSVKGFTEHEDHVSTDNVGSSHFLSGKNEAIPSEIKAMNNGDQFFNYSRGSQRSSWNNTQEQLALSSGDALRTTKEMEACASKTEIHEQAARKGSEAQPPVNWEEQYRGWFYDYGSNEWKRAEAYDSGKNSVSVLKDGPSVLSGSNEVVPSQTKALNHGDEILSSAADLSHREHVRLSNEQASGLAKGMEAYPSQIKMHAPADHGNSQFPQEINWEEQYPGRYDYQAQEWQVDQACQWNNEPRQDNKTATSEVADSVFLSHGSSSSSMPHCGWMEQGQPEQNQNIFGLESSQSLLVSKVYQDVSFHSWQGPGVSLDLTEQPLGRTDLMTETFEHGIAGLQAQNEFQGYRNDLSNYYQQSQTDYVKVEKATFDFRHVEQNPEAHYASRTVIQGLHYSAGRPPHALVAFGFGGKVAVMKITPNVLAPITLHDLSQLVQSADSVGQNVGPLYFSTLDRQGLNGPLLGGGFTNKELFKWIDEQADKCELEDPHCTSSQMLHILWSVLKFGCAHYGKLRGSAGIKSQVEGEPEASLGSLFAAAKGPSACSQGISASPDVLQLLPTEQQLQETAFEIKKCLVIGKRQEALRLAQQGQLWGPALVLSCQLGEEAYADTVCQMAQQQFAPGNPLRTLFLLYAGKVTELFTTQNSQASAGAQGPYSIDPYNSRKLDSAGGMLGDWLENLSIIAANQTKGDDQVITHLGDCLWKEQGEVAGAHICYLVADATFDSFSQNARLCLVGADHFKNQRTFATPQAIQRTELYEYAKFLGNSQYMIVPFQPYKLLYAHMLAEAGKISEARRYCQTVAKSLKNASRTPEIESCRHSATALEERLRLYSQGGYGLNSATGKLMGKFIGTIDSTIHRIIGGPPPRQVSEPSQPSTVVSNAGNLFRKDQSTGNTSTWVNATHLTPPASINSPAKPYNQAEVPHRSNSEPDFSRSPTQEKSHQTTSSTAPKHRKTQSSGGGYLGRLGTQFFAKAAGFINPNKKEASLGDKNKFYYDEKLKRWVEEGAEQNAEEVALPPPPTDVIFGSTFGTPDSDLKVSAGTEGEVLKSVGSFSPSSEMPPMPPSMPHFSARGRLHNVRSRYVDTFNRGSMPSLERSTESPIVPSIGWGLTTTPAQLFVPTSISAPTNLSSQAFGNDYVQVTKSEILSSVRTNSNPNSDLQAEDEQFIPKNLSSSFMVPSSGNQYSASNIVMYANNESRESPGISGGISENGTSAIGNMPKAISWSGDSRTSSQLDMIKAKESLMVTPATQLSFLPKCWRNSTQTGSTSHNDRSV